MPCARSLPGFMARLRPRRNRPVRIHENSASSLKFPHKRANFLLDLFAFLILNSLLDEERFIRALAGGLPSQEISNPAHSI